LPGKGFRGFRDMTGARKRGGIGGTVLLLSKPFWVGDGYRKRQAKNKKQWNLVFRGGPNWGGEHGGQGMDGGRGLT